MKTLFVCLVALLLASTAYAVDRTLSWADNSTNEDGFTVQSCPGICIATGAWTNLAQVGANIQTYRVLNIPLASTTSYRVRAFNNAGTSNFTNIVTDVIPASVPGDPTAATIGP